MKKTAGVLLVLMGFCAAGAYWVDLSQFTDQSKGFSTFGPVWLRYLLLALLVLVAAVASLMAARRPEAMEKRNIPVALLAALCGIAGAAVGILQLVGCTADTLSLKNILLGVFSLLFGWWMLVLFAKWTGRVAFAPAGGIGFGILGSLFFLVLTLIRFAGNYSSIYRFAQTMQTFSALAALLLTAVLLRVTAFPSSRWGRREYMTGMWAFYLCTCCEVPQATARFFWGQIAVSEFAFSLFMGLFGLLGAAVALSALGKEKKKEETE